MGARLRQFSYPKELLPIGYQLDPSGTAAQPQLLIHYSLGQLRNAGVSRSLIVIAPWKLDIVRMLGEGRDLGLDLSFVVREVPLGLGDAIDAAYPWVGNSQVCLVLPDTVVSPADSLKLVREEQSSSGADVVLGVFPTSTPELLGPTRVGASGEVLEVFEKPPKTDLRNTWGMAVWSGRFTEFLHASLAGDESRPTLGVLFQRALESGFRIRACQFENGRYQDLGTPETLGAFLTDAAPQLPLSVQAARKPQR
jgi:glucose-1-phosphate thymidylyltransferase